jgi:5'-3' exonuclease
MGIEKFFNSLREQYDIVENTNYPYKKINTKHLFFDFNSIIHAISQKMINEQINITDDVIIDYVKKQLKFMLVNNFNPEILETIYIGIDGVASKSKMLEQRQRRYMGHYYNIMKSKLAKKYNQQLEDKWSKNNITPGTKFMHKLSNELNTTFREELKNFVPLSNLKTYIVSDIYEFGEGEMKIIKYINKNKYTDDVVIYSPDADVILLSMLLPVNVTILRYDQQESENKDFFVYNIIYINKLKNTLYEYINNLVKVDFHKINSDIVFMFTIFGDDFVPKIESYDVKHDIELLLNKYTYIKENDDGYLLSKNGKKWEINYKFFIKLLKILSEEEDNILIRNYYKKSFKNYDYMIFKINNYISKYKTSYHKVNHFNINNFINKYNLSRELDTINNRVKMKKAISFSSSLVNFIVKNINIFDFCKHIDKSVDKCFLDLNLDYHKYYQKTGNFPKVNKYLKYSSILPHNKYGKIELIKFENSINSKRHKDNIQNLDEFHRELYKLEKLLDEYYEKYNVKNIKLISVEDKNNYYNKFFNNNKDKAIKEYIKGFKWIVDYYYNDKMYNNWTYPYHKSPLLQDIFNYIKKKPDVMDIKIDSHLNDFFSPIEQFMYISPLGFIDLLVDGHDEMNKFIEYAKGDSILKDFYIDFYELTDDNINCLGARFLNKCYIDKMKDIDTQYFIKSIRKFLSQVRQDKIYSIK